MVVHTHHFSHWPFADAVDRACFVCEHVHTGAMPVLRACHDNDGDWQFLCGGDHRGSKPVLVCLGCAVERHKVPLDLADLPRGWAADRSAVDAPWFKEPLPQDEGDD